MRFDFCNTKFFSLSRIRIPTKNEVSIWKQILSRKISFYISKIRSIEKMRLHSDNKVLFLKTKGLFSFRNNVFHRKMRFKFIEYVFFQKMRISVWENKVDLVNKVLFLENEVLLENKGLTKQRTFSFPNYKVLLQKMRDY